jgi:hypothetical protein
MATIPSIALIPSGYKASKLYSVLPTDGSGDLDVVRATTATRVNSSGLIESVASNVPRLDYSNGSCPSILVEPERRNICLNSNDLNSGSYINQSIATITRVTSGAPDGGAFDRLVTPGPPDIPGSAGRFLQVGVNSGANATYSIYLKGSGVVFLNIFNGVSLSSENITLTNTWTRYELTSTGGSGIYIDWSIWLRNGGDIVDVAFQQVELAPYATSYIPTTSESVTRNADVISKTGISDLIGQTEGTVFLEVDYSTLSGLSMFLSIRPDASNKVEVYRDGAIIYGEISAAGSSFAISLTKAVGTHKIAFAYQSGSLALYIDGALVGQSTAAFTFTSSLFDITINSRSGGSFKEAANYKQALLFTTRLSNTDLATLTTL